MLEHPAELKTRPANSDRREQQAVEFVAPTLPASSKLDEANRVTISFLLAGLSIAFLGYLEWSELISWAVFRYARTLLWIGLYAIVVREFRRLEIRSTYFRRVFYVFSATFLFELFTKLPIFLSFFPKTGVVYPITNIAGHAGWTTSCGLILYGLLVSLKCNQLESREKDLALRSLEASEKKLLTIFETAKDSVFVKDTSLKYVQVNKSMEELFGRTKEQLIGSSDVELFGDAAATAQVEDARVLAGETVDTQTTKEVNDIPHTFHVVKVPLRDEADNIFGIVGIARDITDRCKAEASARLAQFSIDRAVDAVLWIREDGTIDYANETANAYLPDSLGERQKIWSIDMHFTPDSWKAFWSDMRSSPDETYETTFKTVDGSLSIEVRANRFTYQNAELLCMFARDISERKRLQIEAQQRLTELSHLSRLQIANEMVGGMAHELNQPLATVANYSHIISTALDSEDSVAWRDNSQRSLIAQKAKVVCDESIRAGEIIRRLRTLVTKREHKRVKIGVNQLVRQTLSIFQCYLVGDAKLTVQENLSDEVFVCADQIQIQQILLNLLSNARDAVQGNTLDPKISISTTRQECCVIVSVEDNGLGFSDLGVEDLFQPFVSSKTDGMGLGLAISRSIAKAHGGNIAAQPVAKGGARFELSLPTAESS